MPFLSSDITISGKRSKNCKQLSNAEYYTRNTLFEALKVQGCTCFLYEHPLFLICRVANGTGGMFCKFSSSALRHKNNTLIRGLFGM
jgi:hypothetical protein